MYVKNYKTKSKLRTGAEGGYESEELSLSPFNARSKGSEHKNRKKVKRKSSKSTKTTTDTTDTKICKNCSIQQEPNYCKVLAESINILYQNLNEYFELKLFGILTKQDMNNEWAMVRHSENSLKGDRVLKQCPKLRKLLNDYFAYRDKKLIADKLFNE